MKIRQIAGTAVASWNRFWFEAECGPQMRLFRKCFGILLFVAYSIRSLDLELFYSDHGLVKLSALDELVPMNFRYSIFNVFPSTTVLWFGNTIFLASLLALAFGVFPRIAALIAVTLHISFLHRNIGASYGVDTISTFYLLYLCLADYRDRPEEGKPRDLRALAGSMAYRFAQIQLCVIYGYSGLQKLRGVYWWKGEGIWSVLANFQMARFDFTWASHFPFLLTLMSFVSLFWEIYFPVLIWIRPIRYPLLVFGVLFHLGIGVSISIPFFAALMIFIYILYLDAPHCVRVEQFFADRLRKVHFFLKGLAGHTEEISV
jgi:hypothetical protein